VGESDRPKANYDQLLEGVSKDALVTHAKINWDLNSFYSVKPRD
jgi:hypothetical protein